MAVNVECERARAAPDRAGAPVAPSGWKSGRPAAAAWSRHAVRRVGFARRRGILRGTIVGPCTHAEFTPGAPSGLRLRWRDGLDLRRGRRAPSTIRLVGRPAVTGH